MIMTTSIQTSAFNTQFNRRNRNHTYQIVVNGEDGNYKEYEIEADSESEARIKADSIAQNCMIDITYVEVYRIA